MERIPLYKYNKPLGYLFIGLGAVGLILSLIFFIKTVGSGAHLKWADGSITPLFQMFQSIALLIFGYFSIWNMRYYVEWNDELIRYRTRESKRVVTISIDKISAINIKVYKIEILADQLIHIIDLENCMYREITKIKMRFSEIK